MITSKDIDTLMQSIKAKKDTYLYYVASLIETREGILDEHIYKSNDAFKVVRIKLTGITNAYLEYVKYHNDANKESNYHTEIEECWYGRYKKYTHFYTVPNDKGTYTKSFNSRMPSIIYGLRREILDTVNHTIVEVSDPTPVKPVYTNTLVYGDNQSVALGNTSAALKKAVNTTKSFYTNNGLDWKYLPLDPIETIDGIDYRYVTSNWWILDIENFPRTEKPLITADEISAYFVDLESALNYIDQLVA
jgi:hypothetical protein